MPEQQGRKNGNQDAEQVDEEDDRTGLGAEKHTRQQYIYWKPRAARHKGQYQHRDEAVLAVFDGTRGHDGRHIAAEADDKRNERFAVQTDGVHELVHNERHPRHIARGFHQRDEEEQNKDIGKEHNHAPHALYNAIHQHRAQDIVGHDAVEPARQGIHAGFYPVHGILPQSERSLEHDPQKRQKYRKSPDTVREDIVQTFRNAAMG